MLQLLHVFDSGGMFRFLCHCEAHSAVAISRYSEAKRNVPKDMEAPKRPIHRNTVSGCYCFPGDCHGLRPRNDMRGSVLRIETVGAKLLTPNCYETLMNFRMVLMAPFSRRETWAWEMPKRLATSIWVLPS